MGHVIINKHKWSWLWLRCLKKCKTLFPQYVRKAKTFLLKLGGLTTAERGTGEGSAYPEIWVRKYCVQRIYLYKIKTLTNIKISILSVQAGTALIRNAPLYLTLQLSPEYIMNLSQIHSLTCMYRMFASHKGTSWGCTYWLHIVVVQDDTRVGKSVYVRSWDFGWAMKANVIKTLKCTTNYYIKKKKNCCTVLCSHFIFWVC